MPDKKHFFLKLNPPRQSFMIDMTDEERSIMQRHTEYWKQYVDNGTILVLGPVMAPNGGFGIAVAAVDNENQINEIITNDPANGLGNYEIYPMRAVTKQ